MVVGFDISQSAHGGGVGVYTDKLAEQLSRIRDFQMKFFYSSLRKPYKGSLKNVAKFPMPPTLLEILFNKYRKFPIESFIGSIDIFHSSDWTQPKTKAKKVTTYHDLVPIKFPNWSHPKISEVHKTRLKIVEKEIDMVIAVSESTKKDLMSVSNIPGEKIVIIYEGVSEIYKPQPERKVFEFKKKYSLPEHFILAIGGIGERKNLRRIKQASDGYNLVIMGEDLPYIPADDTPLLYSSADCLVYTTLYEGFGLPIIEAMACRCPVVTSNVSSMPEIAGDAAIIVDPTDLSQIKKGIEEAISEKDFVIKKGEERAKFFSWEKCAEETASLYRSLIK